MSRGVFLARGTDVNWILVREGGDVTLIDAGYPRDLAAVEASLERIGARPQDVRAILLTHAHIDHVGAVNHFHRQYATPVFTDPVEVAHARRDYLEQAGLGDVVRNLFTPGMLAWAVRAARAGATKNVAVGHAQPFPGAGALDLPGRPVPIATHGHTSGHVAFHLPELGVIATGDGLVTGHPLCPTTGPQLLPPMFHHSGEDAVAALDALEAVPADIILPGHGAAHRLPIADAVARAREAAVAAR